MAYRDPFIPQTQANIAGQAAAGFDAGLRAYMLRIYNYMASALALTGIVAFFTANSPAAMQALYTVNEAGQAGLSGLGFLVVFAPLGLVLWLSFGIHRMSATTAQAIFWVYAALVGASLSSVLLAYTESSVARTFFITAGTFGAISLYGYTTKRDLSGMGHFMIMGLIGLILASIVNIFMKSSGLDFALSVIGVLIFTGLTAWDTQKLKNMYYQVASGGEAATKVAVMGALALYLDFINMFLYLLRFIGDRR